MASQLTPSKTFLLPTLIRLVLLFILTLIHLYPPVLRSWYFHQSFIEKLFDLSVPGLTISGYIFLSGFLNNLNSPRQSYFQFIKKKLIDIYPIYWACLIVATFLRLTHFTPPVFENPLPTITNSVCSLFGACIFIGKWGGPFLATSWFIGLIMALYALFPFILFLMRHFGQLPATLFILSLSLLFRYFVHTGQTSLFTTDITWHPFARLFEFTLGIYLAKIIPSRILLLRKKTRFLGYLAAINLPLYLIHHPLVVIYTCLVALHYSKTMAYLAYLTVSLLAASLILHLCQPLLSRWRK